MKRIIIVLLVFLFLIQGAFATTIGKIKKKCAVCGTESEQTELQSTNTTGYPDLDLRPPEMRRSTMQYWLEECPNCGYAAADIANLDGIPAILVKGEKYQQIKKDPTINPLASNFLRAAYISETLQRLAVAGMFTLSAAWACDDAGDVKHSEEFRLKAAALLQKSKGAGEEYFKEPGYIELLTADMLRIAGKFPEAEANCKKVIDDPKIQEDLKKIAAFQRELIKLKDKKIHTTEEVFGKPEKK